MPLLRRVGKVEGSWSPEEEAPRRLSAKIGVAASWNPSGHHRRRRRDGRCRVVVGRARRRQIRLVAASIRRHFRLLRR